MSTMDSNAVGYPSKSRISGWLRYQEHHIPAEILGLLYELWDDHVFEVEPILMDPIEGRGEIRLRIWTDRRKYANVEPPDYTIRVGEWKILSSRRIVYRFDTKYDIYSRIVKATKEMEVKA